MRVGTASQHVLHAILPIRQEVQDTLASWGMLGLTPSQTWNICLAALDIASIYTKLMSSMTAIYFGKELKRLRVQTQSRAQRRLVSFATLRAGKPRAQLAIPIVSRSTPVR